MSNAQRWERKTQRRDVVDVLGGFVGNGAALPTTLYFNSGAWTLTWATAGKYTVTLRDKFVGPPIIVPVVFSLATGPAAPVAFAVQAGNYLTPATARWSFDLFVVTTAGALADLPNTARIMFTATWSDTKQP